MIFSIAFFISNSFISALIFMTSFLLPTLGFVCSFSSRLRYKVRVFFLIILFIYFWLHWVFIAACGLSLVGASGDCWLWCVGFSLWGLLLLQSTGSVVVAHGCGCSAACGIFPDQGLNPCPLHWQADSWPLDHQGCPILGVSVRMIWDKINI